MADPGTPHLPLPDPLPDADDRDLITTATDRSLFVNAGAGTGKTRALVERVVQLVTVDGIDLSRIVAITFTEAAARELQDRLRAALNQVSPAGTSVEAATVTTLHGFAHRILSEYPVEAGLPPGFTVMDEMMTHLDREEAWRDLMTDIGDDLNLYELQRRADVLGVGIHLFIDILHQSDDNWDRLDPVAGPLFDGEGVPILTPLDSDDLLSDLQAFTTMRSHCLDPTDRLAVALGDLERSLSELPSDPLARLVALGGLKMPAKNAGKAANWPPEMDKDTVQATNLALQEQRSTAVELHKAEVTEAFQALVSRQVLERVERRHRRGELSFHDLLVLARRLLRTDESVRLRLHQRYTHILLDEFQDTDPIQIELAVLLACPEEPDGRTWEELAERVEPGRLVVVGDPKQSIYRFRRADIVTFTETAERLTASHPTLVANFRSTPGIVEWVNTMFSAAMDGTKPHEQPSYVALVAQRPPIEEAPAPVHLVGGPMESLVGEIRNAEAADLAAMICRIVTERWPIVDEDGPRPARLSDIAILLPSRVCLAPLESALSAANIPYRPETTSLVYATQEVRDVLAALRAIVDPTNAVDVVATVRSALFAITDEELLAWSRAGHGWDYRVVDDFPLADSEAPVLEAFRVLARWRHGRFWQDPAAMVEMVVAERSLRETALTGPRPRDRWRRYRFLAEQARHFTETQGGDLHDFVLWAELQASETARVTEPVPAEPDDDTVRILTIHGSKGLEFPVVALAGGPNQEKRLQMRPQLQFSPDPEGNGFKAETKAGKARTAGFDALAAVEDLMDASERIRLHYVASTRAQDYLVASAYHSSNRNLASMGRRTWELVAGQQPAPSDPWVWAEPDHGIRLPRPEPAQLRLPSGDHEASVARWQAGHDVLLASAQAGRQLSPTALAQLERGERPLAIEVVGDGVAVLAPSQPSGGAALGSAVHEVLELVDFANPVDVDAVVADAAERHQLTGRTDEVARRVADALASDTIALAADHRYWKELYLSVPAHQGSIEGFVDLCIETDEGLIVVDYKTDAIDRNDLEASLAAKMGDYRVQLASYAFALERITGTPVVECRMMFITDHGVHERTIPDLPGAIVQVERLLADQLRADQL